ncbi:tetratricopeptide repeat protein [Glycomyces sp. MUSA5-2]|uniref:tetratricopeptide repeat protein n=1 Tax=Glycomyces sp. MUSA5-2 TaxID=2053002 RepID=UPI0030089D9D
MDGLVSVGKITKWVKSRLAGEAVAQDKSSRAPDSTSMILGEGQVSVAPPLARLNKRTQGREALISELRNGVRRPSVHVLAGGGGSGKTRVALELAKHAEREGWEVWWVAANRISGSMREVASRIGVPTGQINQAWSGRAHPPDLTWKFLDELSEPWLLVFDNADDPDVLNPSGGPVSDGTGWLRKPVGVHGAVLVTSRDRNEQAWGEWSEVHVVPPLEGLAGAHMLRDLVRDAGSLEDARNLAEALEGLPLALWAAAKYLQSARGPRALGAVRGATDFAGYQQRLRDWASSPLGETAGGTAESLGLSAVEGTLMLSLELIDRRSPQAVALLRALSCFSYAPIPYHALLNTDLLNQSPLFPRLGERDWERMLGILGDFGLVDFQELDRSDPRWASVVSMHPVFQGILRRSEKIERDRSEYCRLNIALLERALRDCDPDQRKDWQVWSDLAPHSVEAVRNTLLGQPIDDSKLVADAVELGRRTVRWLIASGLLKPAEDLVQKLIKECGSFGLDAGDREILGLRHEYGRILLERGDASAAEAELKQVIVERSQLLGEDDPDTLASRHKYARSILEQSRWREAEPLLVEILRAENEHQVRGPEHSDTMVVRHSLARAILYQDSRVEEAMEMLEDILEVMHRNWPPDNPQTLFVRQSKVTALQMRERWDEALDEVEAALEDANHSTAGAPSPESFMLRHQKGVVLLGLGREDEAWAHLKDLHQEERVALGMTHATTELTSNLLERMRQQFPD